MKYLSLVFFALFLSACLQSQDSNEVDMSDDTSTKPDVKAVDVQDVFDSSDCYEIESSLDCMENSACSVRPADGCGKTIFPCFPNDILCGQLATPSLDPDGNCWRFTDNCLPPDFTEFSGSYEQCEITCGN